MAVKTGILEYAAATVRKWNKLTNLKYTIYSALTIALVFTVCRICQLVKIAITAKPILKSQKMTNIN